MKETKEMSFEEALGTLEKLVLEMENDETTLEKTIKSYKQGLALYEHCAKILDTAEKEVLTLENLE